MKDMFDSHFDIIITMVTIGFMFSIVEPIV